MLTSGDFFLNRHLLARLLTLACFFQFAGFNNGYLHSASLSSPVPSQSIAQVQLLTSNFRQAFNPSKISQPLQIAAQATVQWTVQASLRLQNAALQLFSPAALPPAPFSSLNGKSLTRGSDLTLGVQMVALREFWDRLNILKLDLNAPSADAGAARLETAASGKLAARLRQVRLGFLEIESGAGRMNRRVSHASDEDGAAKFKYQSQKI